jgi:ParB family transcriptional regulator, chromosome partitioning protein
MAGRHDAVFDDVLGGMNPSAPESPSGSPPESTSEARPRQAPERAGGRFLNRSNALSERLSGDVVEKVLLWVEPERCRMWGRHNRRYELLSERRCADLIEGFKAQGQQEFPAVVRRITGDPDHDYEVICGARRHWTVAWLRAHNYRQFRFLIEVRDLSDEEAFRLGDIENRDRADISDYERALDYADAVGRYYNGRQKDMSARLEVSEAWLSRYLGLAKLPKIIVEAYADITDIKERHAREINPLLSDPDRRKTILEAAKAVAKAQHAARQGQAQGKATVLGGAAVIARLKAAATPKPPPRRPAVLEYTSASGEVLVTARPQKGRGLTLQISDARDAEAVLDACRRALRDHLGAEA